MRAALIINQHGQGPDQFRESALQLVKGAILQKTLPVVFQK